MAKKVDRNNLGYLGDEFQIKLVKCFFEDKKYFTKIEHVIDQNMFTNEHLRRIVTFLKDRYQKKDIVSTYDEIRILIRDKITDAISVQYALEMVDAIENMKLNGIDLVEDTSEKFFKQQNLTKAINKAQDIIKKGDFDAYPEIEGMIKDALEYNTKEEFGFGIFDNLEEALSDNFRETITTGCKELDDALGGGIGRGELGLIVAPSNVGKTSLCVGLSAAAATQQTRENNYKGYKVLHFFFEDKEGAIQRKYYGNILDIDAMELSNPDVRPIAIERLKEERDKQSMYKENVRCERLSDGEYTATDIRRKIDSYKARGFVPDLVIIDYFECLKPERDSSMRDSEWSKEGVTMRKLESICNESNMGMWVPIQGTKGSLGADFVGLSHAGGSVAKIQIGHLVITLAQNDDQKPEGRMNVFIQKLRATKVGRNKFINVKFNNGTGKFDMSDLDSIDSVAYEDTLQQRRNVVAKSALNKQRLNN